jgi:hypothetical protein
MKSIPALLIDEEGDVHTLYNEMVELRELGLIHHVRRASHITFDPDRQEWMVTCAVTGQRVHTDPSREAAVAWEIEHFQPGGRFNQQ